MEKFLSLQISENSSTPKYKQIVNSIIEKLEAGKIQFGQKLPSINQLSFDYLLARDTVEKAYSELKRRGIIESVKGKGFYVKNTHPESKLKILVLFNKLSSYKKVIYNAMAQEMKDKAQIDLFIFYYNYELFEKIITERVGEYNYYVIMPHFNVIDITALSHLLRKIPQEKIIILDRKIEGLEHFNGIVHQDFKMDIYNAMIDAEAELSKYEKVILVFPENIEFPYPKEIILGFRRYCAFNKINFEIINEISVHSPLSKKTAYIIIEENDLVHFIKNVHHSDLEIGKDIGVLSYNDTPLKEVLENGISVITTNFEKMGQLTAHMILDNKPVAIKNEFTYIKRHSL